MSSDEAALVVFQADGAIATFVFFVPFHPFGKIIGKNYMMNAAFKVGKSSVMSRYEINE